MSEGCFGAHAVGKSYDRRLRLVEQDVSSCRRSRSSRAKNEEMMVANAAKEIRDEPQEQSARRKSSARKKCKSPRENGP
jgi:hypothetical protein